MTLGSLFDGSGGFPLGAILCGITPVWAAEVEPYPIKVTKTRIPFMKHLGNVSEIDGAKIEPVDIITFGSPCKDLSIAGNREGLHGNRSGLFHEAMRIVKEMRIATNGEKPRYDVRFTSEGTKNARANVYETDVSRTISTGGTSPDANQGGGL